MNRGGYTPSSSIHLDLEDHEPYKLVEIHPVVLFSILDQYIRRNESQDRVIGTLIGTIEDGVVQVNSCFVVPANDIKDQVEVNIEFQKTMIALHSIVSPQEQVVGWYTTIFHHTSSLLHDYYWKEMNKPPVHIIVDPSYLEKGSLSIHCYHGSPVIVGERGKLQVHFRPLRYVLKAGQGERTTLEKMISHKDKEEPVLLSDLDSLELALKNLIDMISNVSAYVHEVATDQKQGDIKVGRLIEETLALLPAYEESQFSKIFDKGLQDILMVVYLANLTRTHLVLGEQLRESAAASKQGISEEGGKERI